VTAADTWDIRPFEAWIVEEFLPSLWVGPGPADYARRPGDPDVGLYGTADVACLLYTLDRFDAPASRSDDWLAALAQFQDEASGFFVDRSGMLTTAHNTGFAVGAMNLFQPDLRNGELPPWPLRFGRLVTGPPDADRYVATLDWRNNCYGAGEDLIGHASTFFNVKDVVPPEWFDWLVDDIQKTKLDPVNGMVGIGKPADGDLDQIGGTFHFDFFWAALGLRLPFAPARATSLLGLQQPSGLWDPNNPWWLSFDAIYMLGRTLPELAGNEAERVQAAIARTVSTLTQRAADPALRASDFVQPWIGAHMLTGALSLFAYAQQLFGPDRVKTSRPLKLVLDRRPYI
jgi:hypothetical protein